MKIDGFIKKLFTVSLRTGPALAWAGAFLLCLIVILVNINPSRGYGSIEEFEAGKVAERDVIAEESISYEDELATRFRIEAQERLIPAVFHYSFMVSEELRARWSRFAALAESLSAERSGEAYRLVLQEEFPGDFSGDDLDLLYDNAGKGDLLRDCGAILNTILERGIYAMPHTGLESLNPNVAELVRQSGSRLEKERVPLENITAGSEAADAAVIRIASDSPLPGFSRLAPLLLKPFLRENIFYSSEDTMLQLAEARSRTEPVMRSIEQGKRIIKKGFIITEEEMEELKALRMNVSYNNLSIVFADLLFLLLLFGLLYYFCGSRIIGRNLTDRESYLVSCLSALYIAGSVLVRTIATVSMPASVVVPTALIVMLPAILIHSRLALLLAMALPLGAFLTGSFNTAAYVFALVSGVVAAYSLEGAEKRMDLVKAGLVIAAANLAAIVAVLLLQRVPAGEYPHSLFWAAFNGIASGMLVLGALPPLEQALNAATSFRLIELSDLNVPVLKRLFTAAPGTYSHSIMVANLAETACQDIGANPLLARVGAYYHDLGKMENPDYFVENQGDYNCHDDMEPRLSASVIRSHVKLGVEKARQLGLPREVIDIIAEHHGNSVITWFYDKAMKQDNAKRISLEDYSYPGSPPRSRESAVVMLADMTEAAVRTLEKPTAEKMKKYIRELISKKVEHGQLSQSELTFRDLETINKAFVRVLAGYYHSRIEYPKIEIAMPEAAQK
jgi:putative nucleotidyltransferase with HDIG domain